MAATVPDQILLSINNLSSLKYSETEFAAVRKTLLPGYNSSDQRLKYHDDLVHIKNGPFDVDAVTPLVKQVIEQCNTLFINANMEPAKNRFILNLAFKTNRDTGQRELLGYGSILLEDRRICKLLIGFDLHGEIMADVVNGNDENESNDYDFGNMTWADIWSDEQRKEQNYDIKLSEPLVKFPECDLKTQELRDAYYRITLDTAKHDNSYYPGMETDIIIPEKYQITVMPFRIKDVDSEFDCDKLICPEFPGNGSISELRQNVLPFATTPNKSHIVRVNPSGRCTMREENATQHRLYPYINNIDNKNKTTKTVVIYFDPSTQDAQKALNFIRTYFVPTSDGNTSKVYFRYRKANVNPFEYGMNEPKPGSGIISDKDDDNMKANYKLRKEKHTNNHPRGGGMPGRMSKNRGGFGRSRGTSDSYKPRGYNVKKDLYGQSTIIFNGESRKPADEQPQVDKADVYQPPHVNNQNAGWRGAKSKNRRSKQPTTSTNIFETL